jgi:hypothetical protein
MDKKYMQSKLIEGLSNMGEIEEANYIVKADDIDSVGDKLASKLDDDDVVKVVDESDDKEKKDINCKCGWGWNKDETDASDMYKCHKCGVDNRISESEYQGKKVKLNKPMRGDVKKYKVYVKNDKGNVVKVNFGDPNMEIRRDNPEAKKSFRARHKCSEKKDKTTAGYWSCKMWSNKKVSDIVGEEENPCWSGYEMVGMKKKDGKEVPNCVKIKESVRPKMTKAQLIESVVRNSKTIFSVKDFISENTNAPITLNGKKINVGSIDIDGVDKNDYPNFVDAYFSYAEFDGGRALTDNELEKLTDEQGVLLNSQIHTNQLF